MDVECAETLMIRAFAALWPPREAVIRLQKVQHEICEAASRTDVRPTLIEKLHITLQFFSQIDANSLARFGDLFEIQAKAFQPFSIRADRLVVLNRATPMVWATFAESSPLKALRQCLEKVAIELGAPQESRRFSPHLTLLRFSSRRPLVADLNRIAFELQKEPVSWQVHSVEIAISHPDPRGRRYEISRSIPLGAGAA